jgi:hypothetical protein
MSSSDGNAGLPANAALVAGTRIFSVNPQDRWQSDCDSIGRDSTSA